MPPSSGYRFASVSTATTSGTKNSANAASHSQSAGLPRLADGVSRLTLTMATSLKRRRSRKVSVRGSSGARSLIRRIRVASRRSILQGTGGLIITACPIWSRVLVALAAAKVVLTYALYLSDPAAAGVRPPLPLEVYAALAATFCVVGLTLAAANRHDARAFWLGGAFVLAATELATPLLRGSAARGFEWLLSVRVDAFLPALLLRFAAELPIPVRPGAPSGPPAWRGRRRGASAWHCCS